MRQLCPPSEVDLPIFRWLFMQRLPASVRRHLKEDRGASVVELASRVDLLVEEEGPYGGHVAAVSEAGPQAELEGQEDLVAAVRKPAHPGNRGGPPRPQSSGKPGGGKSGGRRGGGGEKKKKEGTPFICWRHCRWGDRAYECEDPGRCSWSPAGN